MSINKRTPRALIPIMFLIVITFAFYTLIDTDLNYNNISVSGFLVAGVLFITAVVFVYRFLLTTYEYLIVGDELIIRRRTPHRVTKVNTFHMDNICSIGKCSRFHHPLLKKCYNRCNSVFAALFTGTVMIYHDRLSTNAAIVIIEPPIEVCRLLKLNLEERYYS